MSPYNPVHTFRYQIRNQNCDMVVTSVSGHLMETDFSAEFRSWHSCSPDALFTAPIVKSVRNDPNAKKIEKTLSKEAKHCQWLILWLDCDREGENIAFEVKKVCELSNNRLEVFRAKFSALIPRDIQHAIQSLVAPDERLSNAVDARSEIDLRLGAAFTRFQTLYLQNKYSEVQQQLISYGPCQFPTLGFVVDRYLRIEAFVREPFWVINVKLDQTDFQWVRQRLYDRVVCIMLYNLVMSHPVATVEHMDAKDVTRRKPVPLATVELQKRASRWLGLPSEQTMRIAESLYTKGIISYPRTETEIFKEGTDLTALLQLHEQHHEWGGYTRSLLQGGKFMAPRRGRNDDQAHPPIHPTKSVALNELSDEEKKVYDLVTRHFLACCSQDAKGHETKVKIDISGEKFSARGLMIIERNYLDIYKWDKWSASTIPVFQVGDQFAPTSIEMTEGRTQPPGLLTESDLIALMDQHGIGTDATIAEHIKTIQQREYAIKVNQQFKPTKLGLALVKGYDQMGYQLSKPYLRAEMEKDCTDVAHGRKSKDDVVQNCILQMKQIFQSVVQQSEQLDIAMSEYFTAGNGPESRLEKRDFSMCGVCRGKMELRKLTHGRLLRCTSCNKSYSLFMRGNLSADTHICPLCQFQVLKVEKDGKGYTVCPSCYNGSDVKMPCFKCQESSCSLAKKDTTAVLLCPKTQHPCTLRKLASQKYVVSCTGYPTCKFSIWLPSGTSNASVTATPCPRCPPPLQVKQIDVSFQRGAMPPHIPLQLKACCRCDPIFT